MGGVAHVVGPTAENAFAQRGQNLAFEEVLVTVQHVERLRRGARSWFEECEAVHRECRLLMVKLTKRMVPRVRHAMSLRRVTRPGAVRAEPVLVGADSHGFGPPVRHDWKVIAWFGRPEPVAPCSVCERPPRNKRKPRVTHRAVRDSRLPLLYWAGLFRPLDADVDDAGHFEID